MKRFFFWFLLMVASGLILSYAIGKETRKAGELKVSSPAFENNGSIPKKYSCDGANVNPGLLIDNTPSEAKSLALLVDDIDAPRGTYVHWIVWNIDPKTKEIKENSVPEGAVQGSNDFKKQNYGGPCPPSRAHRYVFRLYALDIRLDLDARSTKADLEKAIKGHILAQGEVIGSYKRK